jgi:hypothetical protein
MQLVVGLRVCLDTNLSLKDGDGMEKRIIFVRIRSFTVTYGAILTLGLTIPVAAQSEGPQQPSAHQEGQNAHTAQSIDEELARLTRDLELTAEQQQQVRFLLQEHHDKIQLLLDHNPNVSRETLAPQIHAISDETHHEIHALLTDHQKELEKAMQLREHNGEEHRRPDPPAPMPSDPSL